jgi:tyrosine-protein phosphatase YwqE
MISFFSKKTYLVDLLDGFTDIHSHILPGIDDGAKTTEDSKRLLKSFGEFGVKNFITTPHIMHNYHDNSPATINTALAYLKNELIQEGLDNITIEASAEHMIDDNFEVLLTKKQVMPLSRDHLLVEMSYLQPPINFDTAIEAVKHNRYFPVLAHPERYSFLHGRMRRYHEFKQQGIQFQLNMLSLGEYYGKEVSKSALKFLEEGMIDFIGSDVHNMDHIAALKKVSLSKKMVELVMPVIDRTKYSFSL